MARPGFASAPRMDLRTPSRRITHHHLAAQDGSAQRDVTATRCESPDWQDRAIEKIRLTSEASEKNEDLGVHDD